MHSEVKFKLSKTFVAKFIGLQPLWGPLGYVTFKRTYARPVEGENRTEEFWETLVRVVEGVYTIQKKHCTALHLEWKEHKAQRSAQTMFALMWEFKMLPPGRGLQMMGTPLVERLGNAALQNCAFVSTVDLGVDFTAPFAFMMDMSMLGVGVGADTLGAGSVKVVTPNYDNDWVYQVPDTREGWVNVLRLRLGAYRGIRAPGYMDYSQVRPYGAPIRGFGGTASGPAPLAELVSHIDEILMPLVGQAITSTAIVDLFNAIGRCVVSGNVRRSAQIMFGLAFDQDFLALKDPTPGNWQLNKWRWASNNSVFVSPWKTHYTPIVEATAKNGEPGYFWLETAQEYGRLADPPDLKDYRAAGTNPCGEITLESFEFCTLVETFPANHESMEDWLRTLRYAYLYAKTVTLIPSHDPRSNAVMLRNRRIGVSQSGIVQAINKFGMADYLSSCDEGYHALRNIDQKYSEWLCVPQSIKLTTVKPSGTVSLLPGATPGIHFPQSEYYWRTMRFDSGSPLLAVLSAAGYRTVPGEGLNTTIVYFPVRESHYSRSVRDVSIWEQAELAALLQHWWADNQVSVTVNFQAQEKKEIKRVLEMFDKRLKSISFLPYMEHQYEHAPYQPITQEEYEAAASQLRPLEQVLGMGEALPRLFCDSDKCEI